MALALRELNIDIHPVTIDMGYEGGWSSRINGLAESLGLRTQLLMARRGSQSDGPVSVTIQRQIGILDGMTTGSVSGTPCTHCYNVKVLMLEAVARKEGATRVAFGHHITDASASLLKEALMFIDRWDNGNSIYDRRHFEELATELANEAFESTLESRSPLMEKIEGYVRAGKVDTDEPPRQPLMSGSSQIDIVRPLFGVEESSVSEVIGALQIRPEGSGCGHSMAIETQTPREMIHYRVLRSAANDVFRMWVRNLVEFGVGVDGMTFTRSRQRRAAELGAEYKPTMGDHDKL